MPAQPAKSKKRTVIPVMCCTEYRSIPNVIATIDGIQKAARKKGYGIKLHGSGAELAQDGDASQTVIVVGVESSRTTREMQALEALDKQLVVCNMDAEHIDSHYSCATFSRRLATEQMLEYLIGKGCRSVALLGCGDLSANDMVHIDAMEEYLHRFQQGVRGDSFCYHQLIEESFQPFLKRRQDYDAALCPNDYAAVAFLRFCESAGIRVPEQLLLATLRGNFISRYCRPSITSYSVDFFAIGENAVLVWLFMQDGNSGGVRLRISVPGRIDERESTRPNRPLSPSTPRQRELGSAYQGGPFYREPSLQALMQIERCLQSADKLDLQIIECLLSDMSYEKIAERLYLSDSSLQYRIRNLFHAAKVGARSSFMELFQTHFPSQYHFVDSVDPSSPPQEP